MRVVVGRVALVAHLFLTGSLCAQSSDQAPWLLVGMELSVTIDTSARTIGGQGWIEVEFLGGPHSDLELELGPTGRFMTTVAQDGVRQTITDSTRIRVSWSEEPREGERRRVSLIFAHASRGSQILVDQRAALASWVTGWYPSPRGRPSRAPGTISFEVPPGWSVASNGRPLADGGNLTAWHSLVPVDWSFVAADFVIDSVASAEGHVARVFTLRDSERKDTTARAYALQTAAVLEALEPVFGAYPYPGYGVVEIPDGLVTWGGSSEQGFFMAPRSALGRRVNLPLLAHELSHGWWGNRVQPAGEAALMVTEALAQLGAALAIERLEGPASAIDFLRFSREGYNSWQSARGYFTLRRLGYDKALGQLDGSGQDHNLSDAKGHWFYLMLRDHLGHDRFADLMRGLAIRFADDRMSLRDLREDAIRISPNPELTRRFLADWLDRPGAPCLEMTWRYHTADTITVEVRQVGELYALDVPVELVDSRGSRIIALQVREAEAIAVVRIDEPVLAVRLDPDHRILRCDLDYGSGRPGGQAFPDH